MSGRKRWLLVVVALLLLLPAGPLGGEEKRIPAKKLGLAADLIEFYQSHDRMSDANWAAFIKSRREEILKLLPPPPGGKRLPVTPRKKVRHGLPKELVNFASRRGTPGGLTPLNRLFFDEGEQRRKGFVEDTYECLVSLQGKAGILTQAGAKVLSSFPGRDGTIARVRLAGKKLAEVAALPEVRSLTPVMKRALDNDLGTDSTGAPRLRVGTPGNWDPNSGLTGSGVVVGLIDSGIDWTHPDFSDPVNGGTRIQYIWDTELNTAGRDPETLFGLSGLDYGTVWTKAEIDGASCTSIDTNGHGTHTSGTAAGNGGATGNYTGMAPNADIILVQGLDINGVWFIYEMASLLGRPCAVNMSFGYSYPVHYACYWPEDFPMDPTDVTGQWIDQLNRYYGGGHIPVKSAGNIGHWNTYTDRSGGYYPYKEGGYHWGTKMGNKTTHAFKVPDYEALWNQWWGFPPGPGDVPELYFGGWLERPGSVKVTDPSGTVYEFPFGSGYLYILEDGTVLIGVISPTPAANGAYSFWLWVAPLFGYYNEPDCTYTIQKGKWKMACIPETGGKGRADFWVSDWNLWNDYDVPGIDWYTQEIYTTFTGPSSHSNYIVDEGATPFEISVGAWTTRKWWESIDGHTYGYIELPWLRTIADFSSPGPSRDRFTKPDIAAPGQTIISALSQDSPYASYPPLMDPDGQHMALSGTSMAAPHVTGGVALMLQRSPNLSVDSVRSKLALWATKDLKTKAIGPNGFGAGKLNIVNAACVPVPVLTVDRTTLDLSAGQTATFVGSNSYDPCNLPWRVRWQVLSAPEDADYKLIIDEHLFTATLIPDPKKTGNYKVGMFVDGQARDSAQVTAMVQAVE